MPLSRLKSAVNGTGSVDPHLSRAGPFHSLHCFTRAVLFYYISISPFSLFNPRVATKETIFSLFPTAKSKRTTRLYFLKRCADLIARSVCEVQKELIAKEKKM